MTIEEYEEEAKKDLIFNVSEFEAYCKSLGNKRIKWSRYVYNEECIETSLDDKLRELYKEKFHYYTYEYNEFKIEKKNIEIYIKGDPEYRVAQKEVLKQVSKTKFVNEVLQSIDKQSFACSNILKHMIWQSGASAV